jgi:hypothetical protein
MSPELRASLAVPPPSAGERGSAYLFALLVLLVLTVLGLSLALITQTEVQIGGAEKSANRVLYGADAGLRMQFALSRFASTRPRRFELESTPGVAGAELRETVDVSPFMPLYTGPCNLCTVNYGETRYWAINYAANAQSRRSGIVGTEEIPQANKLLSMMFFVQPEQERKVDESIRVFDPAQDADDPDEDGLDIIRY